MVTLNYITEINSFYSWVALHPLPPDAQALWHFLMQMNNRCAVKIKETYYWPVEFVVPNSTATSVLAFSRQQLDRMRNKLIQAGRIVYSKGKGSSAGKYRMIPFDAKYVTQSVTQPDTQTDTQTSEIWVLCNNMSTLINNNKLKINNPCDGDDGGVRVSEQDTAFEEQVSILTYTLLHRYWKVEPTEADRGQVRSSVITIDRSEGNLRPVVSEDRQVLLEYAFEQSNTARQHSWRYVNGVLKNLRARGIENETQLAEYEFKRDTGKEF